MNEDSPPEADKDSPHSLILENLDGPYTVFNFLQFSEISHKVGSIGAIISKNFFSFRGGLCMKKSGNGKKRAERKLPINGSCILVIEEYGQFSRWSIVGKKDQRVLIRFERHTRSIRVSRSSKSKWEALHSKELGKEINYSSSSNALEALALFFHEVGHHRHGIRWKKKPTAEEELLDERLAWAFSLRELRRISELIKVKLINNKNKKGLLKNIHRCIKTYEC